MHNCRTVHGSPPSTKAETSSWLTSISWARKWRKRAESSTPAMPTTMWVGRPLACWRTQTMASSGLVMQMTKALGQCFLMPSPTACMTLVLMSSRSSRLMPGLRGTPAVTMTTSAPLIALYFEAPASLAS